MSTTKNNDWLDPNAYRTIDWSAIRRFLAFYKPLKGRLAMAVVLTLIASAMAFFIPAVFAALSDALSQKDGAGMVLAVSFFLGILLIQAVLNMGIEKQQAHVFTFLNRNLLLSYYEKVLRISVPSFLQFQQKTNLFQRVIDAMNITSTSTRVLVTGIRNFVNCVALLLVIGMISSQVVALVAVGSLILLQQLIKRQPRLRQKRQKTLGFGYPLVSKLLETLNCLVTIKSLAASPRVTSDIGDLVDNKRRAECDENLFQADLNLLTSVITSFTQIAALGLCLWSFQQGQLALSEVFAIYVLMGLLLGSIQGLAGLYMELAVISVNFRNYFEVFDLPDEQRIDVADTAPTPIPLAGKIQFNRTSFAYHAKARRVVDNMSFVVQPGERIALIGKSGAGKTTMIRLLLDFLKVSDGQILIDDKPIHAYENKNAYRNNFGIVNQNDFFFQISLRENLVFGMDEPASDEKIIDTLKKVNMWETIAKLEQGLDTVFANHQFSGGEKQRLFIARALVRDPRIVLMDEPTSALDFESERAVMEAMDVLLEGKTAFIIAHRLSTVQNADRLFVLQEGRIVAAGRHGELYQSSAYYRDLCDYSSYIAS